MSSIDDSGYETDFGVPDILGPTGPSGLGILSIFDDDFTSPLQPPDIFGPGGIEAFGQGILHKTGSPSGAFVDGDQFPCTSTAENLMEAQSAGEQKIVQSTSTVPLSDVNERVSKDSSKQYGTQYTLILDPEPTQSYLNQEVGTCDAYFWHTNHQSVPAHQSVTIHSPLAANGGLEGSLLGETNQLQNGTCNFQGQYRYIAAGEHPRRTHNYPNPCFSVSTQGTCPQTATTHFSGSQSNVEHVPGLYSQGQNPSPPYGQHFCGPDPSGSEVMHETQGLYESLAPKLRRTQTFTPPQDYGEDYGESPDFVKLLEFEIEMMDQVHQGCRFENTQGVLPGVLHGGNRPQANQDHTDSHLNQHHITSMPWEEFNEQPQRYRVPQPSDSIFQHSFCYYTPPNSSSSTSDFGEATQGRTNFSSVPFTNPSYHYPGPYGVGRSPSHTSSSSPDLQQRQFHPMQQQQLLDNIDISNVHGYHIRETTEMRAYRECSSPADRAKYWNSRHDDPDSPRPTPIKYKSPEERAVARLDKKASDELRKAKKVAVREKHMEKKNAENDVAVMVG